VLTAKRHEPKEYLKVRHHVPAIAGSQRSVSSSLAAGRCRVLLTRSYLINGLWQGNHKPAAMESDGKWWFGWVSTVSSC